MAYYITGYFIVRDQSKTGGGMVLPLFHGLIINSIIVVHNCVIVGKQCVLVKIIRNYCLLVEVLRILIELLRT